MTATPIEGSCDDRFEAVREVFSDSFAKGEVGAAVSVTLDGQSVIDLWGGYTDQEHSSPWKRDTIVNVYSTTKGMAAVCVHRLVDAGRIDLDAPLARYWPEFADKGKHGVTVRQTLSHQAGVVGFGADIPQEKSFDWDVLCASLASQEPAWEPGAQHGYHAKSFGHLVGELLRRVDGRSIGRYFREEVAGPLDVDFQIGLPDREHARCADVIAARAGNGRGGAANLGEKVLGSAGNLSREQFIETLKLAQRAFGTGPGGNANAPEWRRAEIPAANGHGTARGLARVYGALARGGKLDGFELLSSDAIAQAAEEQVYGPDRVLFGLTTRFGLGFFLSQPQIPFGPSPRAFGHPGLGGSVAFADPDARIGFGYVMNQMQSTMFAGSHGFRLIDEVYRCLGVEPAQPAVS